MTDKINVSGKGTPDDMVLHVIRDCYNVHSHIVSSRTIAIAKATDAASEMANYGELRRYSGIRLLEPLLEQRLNSQYGATTEDYVAAIEHSVGRKPASDDLTERLSAVADVKFGGVPESEVDGSDYLGLPADTDTYEESWYSDTEGVAREFRGYNILSKAMSRDVPRDLFKEFGVAVHSDSISWSGHIDDHVADDRLDALIAALEARGYTVIHGGYDVIQL